MGVVGLLVLMAVFCIFLASQVFWFRKLAEWGAALITSPKLRRGLAGAGAIVYILLFAYMMAWSRSFGTPTHLTPGAALLEAPFQWWLLSSLLGGAAFLLLVSSGRLARLGQAIYRRAVEARRPRPAPPDDPPAPARRRFLEQTASVLSAAPFVVTAYGLFYGRLNLETTRQRIRLPRLPKAFHGFRIAQLSDIHIGPFMTEEEIRKYVGITNDLRPDAVLLTGDFVTWDARTQGAVVEALAGLKAPYGIYGCLGNHEIYAGVEDSITRLFAARDIRILRNQNVEVRAGADSLNLIGVDFQSVAPMGLPTRRSVRTYLAGVDRLMRPDTANILLTHNPNPFDRAAELGIDLSIAGHTHGGQITLEFIHPSLTPSRLITDYVRGWFAKGHSQLYVNRGIGTIIFPVRLGSRPEITLFELVREGAAGRA